MSRDCSCPFCGEAITIDEPMGDDEEVDWECPECDREFIVTASYYVTYDATCKDGEHDLIPSDRHSGWGTCSHCNEFMQFPETEGDS